MNRWLNRVIRNYPARILAALIGLSATGCDSPFSEDGNGGSAKADTVFIVGKDTLFDSLDAERGREKLNTYEFVQGNLFGTGNVMDLAIDGHGFFILKNDTQNVFFRRPGHFNQDADGFVNLGNPKVRLQGLKLYSPQDPYGVDFIHPVNSAAVDLSRLTDVHWPFDDLAPPRATTEIRMSRNLDSDAMGKGTIIYSQKFLHHAEDGDLLVGLTDHAGDGLGIQTGDVLTLSASTDSGVTASTTVEVEPGMTLAGADGLLIAISKFLRGASVNAGLGTTVDMVKPADSETLRGAICIYNNTSAAIRNFQVTSSRPISGPKVTKAFAVQTTIPPGTSRLAVATETLRAPAQPTDPLSELYDAGGNGLGLENGDVISFFGSLGGAPADNAVPLTYAKGPAGAIMRNVLDRIKDNFKLPDRDGTVGNRLSVELNTAGSDDNIPDGSIVVRGQPETAWSIQDASIRSTDFNNAKPSPTLFNANLNMTTLREASDSKSVETSIAVHDETGKEHDLTMRFTPTATPNLWLWSAKLAGEEILRAGSQGRITFGQDGSVATFTFEGAATRLEFDPGNGVEIVSIALQAGGPADFTGLTQFRSEGTAVINSQNGFAAGKLRAMAISPDGVFSGSYTNGQIRNLYRIGLAEFPNRRGLKLIGGNTFLETKESGEPAVNVAGVEATGKIAPGAIEYVTDSEFAKLCEVHPDCKTVPSP